ncbi:MAG TPA: efflux RND transporter periplasmic adaptor subunit, partial [Thermoanaerobaculia bacterium]|nr:efflux RND transporter periplasmic adaptor subunit [Thermoanaerobaculia bacterium]
ARAVRGTLRITVALSGTLAPARAESFGPDVPGAEMKIVELAPEGARVAPGALLVRFDDAPFRRDLAAAEARLLETKSEEEQARQALVALEASEKSERSEAEAALVRADLDLSTFEKGTSPLALRQSEAAVERARREAEDAQVKLDGLLPFAEKGYVSREELRAAKLRAEQAQADLALAAKQHETLVAYTEPQLLAQKKAELMARKEALANLAKKGGAQVAQARAATSLAKARAAEASRAVDESRAKLAKCVVTAKSSGLVVYREIFEKGGERRKVRLGDSVFAGQPVLDLPDLSEMRLAGRVRESDIHRVEPGQKAEIRLDAFPDRSFTGRVLLLGALSAGESGDARTFPLVLALDATEPRFRPGMSGRALVAAGEVANVVQVPIDAVRYEGREAYCLVKGISGTKRRSVVTGKSNAFFVEIKEGLAEGDVVLVGGR